MTDDTKWSMEARLELAEKLTRIESGVDDIKRWLRRIDENGEDTRKVAHEALNRVKAHEKVVAAIIVLAGAIAAIVQFL